MIVIAGVDSHDKFRSELEFFIIDGTQNEAK